MGTGTRTIFKRKTTKHTNSYANEWINRAPNNTKFNRALGRTAVQRYNRRLSTWGPQLRPHVLLQTLGPSG